MSPTVSVDLNRRTALAAVPFIGLALSGLLHGAVAMAAGFPINTLKNSAWGGRTDTAIEGHDPVAYFTAGKPVRGREDLMTEWKGAKWKFASAENLSLFKADPEKYAPQYGGYCAFGVSQGYLVKVDPAQFTVRDGKLYLNYNAEVQANWLKEVAGHVRKADQNFPQLLQK